MVNLRELLGDEYGEAIDLVVEAVATGDHDYLGCGCCSSYDYEEARERTGQDSHVQMAAHDALEALVPWVMEEGRIARWRAAIPAHLPEGLCGNREDHEPHLLKWAAVANGPMWCHANQSVRVPYARERNQP